MNNFDNILQLARDGKKSELLELARSQGMKVHHSCGPQKIAEAIINHVTQLSQPVKHDAMKHPAEQPQAAPMHINTPEEVREACKQFFEKDGFEVRFRDDDTWHFRCKGAEDSGHMSVPLRVLKLKAMTVSGGARRLVTDNKNFDDNAGQGFANQVMRI